MEQRQATCFKGKDKKKNRCKELNWDEECENGNAKQIF